MDGLMFPALLVSLSAGALWLVRRRLRRTAPATAARGAAGSVAAATAGLTGGPLVCPTCLRRYPQGLRFCPTDARALVSSDDWSVEAGAVSCGVCRRSFDPGTRFCPFDSEEL